MEIPIDITFRDMETSPALVAAIEEAAGRLEEVFQPIQRCTVVIETPPQRGRAFHVVLALTVPGREITVSRDTNDDASSEDAYAAVAHAFRSARRQLLDFAERRRSLAS